jgi:hypothetical protein
MAESVMLDACTETRIRIPIDLEQIEKPDQTDPQKVPARLLEKYQALASQVQPLSFNQRALLSKPVTNQLSWERLRYLDWKL